MARPNRNEVREDQLVGFKYLDKIVRMLDRLHEAGCARDRAHNRRLHMDPYTTLILLRFFNPALTSLRGIQRASALRKVQRKLGVPRASMGSLSEAMWTNSSGRGLKMHAHFDLLNGVPVRIDLTDGGGNERAQLQQTLLPERVYEALEDRPLSDDDHAAAVRVRCPPHRMPYKTGRGGPEQGEELLIATNLTDATLSAGVVALIYQERLGIEIFFRFFKHVLGCRHLLSHCVNGIRI
jgi:IS4 transposase